MSASAPPPVVTVSKGRWMLMSLAMIGLQIEWAVEYVFLTPTLLQSGVSPALAAIAWIPSTLVQLWLSPVLGRISDSAACSARGRASGAFRRRFWCCRCAGKCCGAALANGGAAAGAVSSAAGGDGARSSLLEAPGQARGACWRAACATRRHPFLAVTAVLAVAMMVVLVLADRIVAALNLPAAHPGAPQWGRVIVFEIAFVVLDACNSINEEFQRSLTTDIAPDATSRTVGHAVMAGAVGGGAGIGYVLGGVAWEALLGEPPMLILFGAAAAIFVPSTLALLLMSANTAAAVQRRDAYVRSRRTGAAAGVDGSSGFDTAPLPPADALRTLAAAQALRVGADHESGEAALGHGGTPSDKGGGERPSEARGHDMERLHLLDAAVVPVKRGRSGSAGGDGNRGASGDQAGAARAAPSLDGIVVRSAGDDVAADDGTSVSSSSSGDDGGVGGSGGNGAMARAGPGAELRLRAPSDGAPKEHRGHGVIAVLRRSRRDFVLLCAQQVLAWLGLWPIWLFASAFFAASVYDGDATSPAGSAARVAYSDGVRAGSLSCAAMGLSNVVFANALPRATRMWGVRRTYVTCQLIGGACVLLLFWVRVKPVAMLLVAAAGMVWAANNSLPFDLVRVTSDAKDIGLHTNVMYLAQTIPQMVGSLVMGPVVAATGGDWAWAMLVTGGAALAAGAMAHRTFPK